MATKKPMRENISGRPTDSSGRRASDIDLGLVRSPVKKPMPEGISSRPTDKSGKRATDADLGMTRAAPKVKPMTAPKPKPLPKPMAKPVQVIRTTQMFKPSPMTKKR